MIFSRKQKAINSLLRQREKLDDNSYYKDWQWVAQTADIVANYIGKDTALHITIRQLKFGVWNDGTMTNEQMHIGFENKKKDARRFIDDCIDYIRINGIVESKNNFLSRLSDRWLIFIVGTIIPGLFYLGYKTHDLTSDYLLKKETINRKKDIIIDSLKFEIEKQEKAEKVKFLNDTIKKK